MYGAPVPSFSSFDRMMHPSYYGSARTPRSGSRSRSREKKVKKVKKKSQEKKEKKHRKSSRGTSREKHRRQEAVQMVPDKDAYLKLLGEVQGWNELKKKNLIVNAFAMLNPDGQREVRKLLAPRRKEKGKAAGFPPADRKTDLLCFVNVLETYTCRAARVPEGSYIFAFRKEWGFLALYKKVKHSHHGKLFGHHTDKKLPTWEELLERQPIISLFFLEVSDLVFTDSAIRFSTLNADKPLKLQFATKDFLVAAPAIRLCHKACRPFQPCSAVSEFYVDGEEFFPCLADAMLGATREILMAAWWLSPYVYLKRDAGDSIDQNYRLDNLLQRKAFEGVKVHILLYQDIERATALTSQHTKTYLESLHSNIRVLRHRGPLVFTHHQKFTVLDWRILFIGGLDPCYGRYDSHDHPLFDPEGTVYPGLDYRNPLLVGDDVNSQTKYPFQSTLNRKEANRMPWHDVHIKLVGRIAYDAGLNFAQRWHHHQAKKAGEGTMITPDVTALYEEEAEPPHGNVKATLTRSMAEWSGNPVPEKSIHQSYLNLIENAKHFVYIENQYFISSVYGPEVTNRVAAAIVDRIAAAYDRREQFRVLMLIQPHGEGDPVADQFIRSILYFQNQTLSKMTQQLTRLLGSAEEVEKHFVVGYIQQHGFAPGTKKAAFCPIYIHSKFVMADDLRFIVGSANINDRSFNGDRDSELAVFVEQDPKLLKEGVINGSAVQVGPDIRDLRIRLWMEHFDLPAADVADPVSDATWSRIKSIMQSNTNLYNAVFPGSPRKEVTTLEEAQRQAAKPPNDESLLSKIKGHACCYPINWMGAVLPTLVAQAAGTALYV